MELYLCRMCQYRLHAASALVAHWFTYAPPLCKTLQDRKTFIYSSCSVPVERSCWPRIRWFRTSGFQEQSLWFFICLSCMLCPFCLLLFFSSSFFLFVDWYCGAGVFGQIGWRSLSPSLALSTFFNNNNNNNNNNGTKLNIDIHGKQIWNCNFNLFSKMFNLGTLRCADRSSCSTHTTVNQIHKPTPMLRLFHACNRSTNRHQC